MGRIILIGGAPAIGKSYLAEQLSLKLHIPWISTDNIHELMLEERERRHVSFASQTSSQVFDSEGQPPPSTLRKETPQETLVRQQRACEDVWQDVLLFIKKNDLWENYIIEGIAILPHLINQNLKRDESVRPLFLLDANGDRLRNIIRMKGVWKLSGKYAQGAKSLDLEWVLLFNTWLKEQVRLYDFPHVELSEESMSIKKILEIVE